VPIVVENQNARGKPHEDERTETAAILGRAEPGRDIFAGEPIKEIKSMSKQPEKEGDVPERAPKKISLVTLSTESVKAESAESSKVETPDATSTTSEKEKQEPLVVAVDGPEGAAAKKDTAGPLIVADAEAEKVAQELYPEAAS
jgi:dolichyl-phosphate-mannose-protein mannosyltransferase